MPSQKSKLDSTTVVKNTTKSLLLEPLCAKSPCRLQRWGKLVMGQCAAPCHSGSSVLHGMLSWNPQEGTVSLGSTAVTPSLLLLGLGERKGFEPHEVNFHLRAGGEQLSLQLSLNAGIMFSPSFTLPKCSVPNSRPALC